MSDSPALPALPAPPHPTLDWRSSHDPRSRNFSVRALASPTSPAPTPPLTEIRARRHGLGPLPDPLDQGQEGACVGFAWTHELLASPYPAPRPPATTPDLATRFARALYTRAQRLDEWPGEEPTYSGTSVLAGARALRSLALITEYRWAFSVQELGLAISSLGPAVLGIPWYAPMYSAHFYNSRRLPVVPHTPDPATGPPQGGHAILVYGYSPSFYLPTSFLTSPLINTPPHLISPSQRYPVFIWRNSWGSSYGSQGRAVIPAHTLALLLAQDGEACVPVTRRAVTLSSLPPPPGPALP